MSDPFAHNPPPGAAILTTGSVQAGDWFYIEQLGAWALCPACAFGEKIENCGHTVARSINPEHNVATRAEKFWRN